MKGIVWSLFWILFATTLCSAQTTLYFPQIADGRSGGFGWVTAIAITNPAPLGSATASVTLSFNQDDGTALNLPLTDLAGQPVSVSAGSFGFQISGGQTRLYVSTGLASSITTGFATITSNLPVVGAVVFFEFTDAGARVAEAGVAAAAPLTQQATIVSKNNQDTGVAVANPGTQTGTVTFLLLDTNGASLFPAVTRSLAGKNHTAFFVSQLFPNLPNGFFGTLRITSSIPIVTTSLLFENDGKFATLPVFAFQ